MRFEVAFLVFLFLAACGSSYAQENPLVAAQRSHVDANVPDEKDFQRILKNDITKYVTDDGDKNVTVTIELLRDMPAQSGVALPKFYIWIVKRDANGTVMEEAAARIAAVEKTHFDVIQYYKRERILKEPDLMQKVFPDDVYEKIQRKVKGQ